MHLHTGLITLGRQVFPVANGSFMYMPMDLQEDIGLKTGDGIPCSIVTCRVRVRDVGAWNKHGSVPTLQSRAGALRCRSGSDTTSPLRDPLEIFDDDPQHQHHEQGQRNHGRG